MAGRPITRAKIAAAIGDATYSYGEKEWHRREKRLPPAVWDSMSKADKWEHLSQIGLRELEALLNIDAFHPRVNAAVITAKYQAIRLLMILEFRAGIESSRSKQEEREFELRREEHAERLRVLREEWKHE